MSMCDICANYGINVMVYFKPGEEMTFSLYLLVEFNFQTLISLSSFYPV